MKIAARGLLQESSQSPSDYATLISHCCQLLIGSSLGKLQAGKPGLKIVPFRKLKQRSDVQPHEPDVTEIGGEVRKPFCLRTRESLSFSQDLVKVIKRLASDDSKAAALDVSGSQIRGWKGGSSGVLKVGKEQYARAMDSSAAPIRIDHWIQDKALESGSS